MDADEGLFELGELAPWERQPGEPSRAFEVFELYLRQGGGRSLRRLSDVVYGESAPTPGKVKRMAGQIGLWSRTWRWSERAAAWDDLLSAERRRELRAENIDAARRQAELGKLAYERVRERLEQMRPNELSAGQLAALATAGVRIERAALGMDLDATTLDDGEAAEFDETPETAELAREYARRHALAAEGAGTPS